MIKDKELRINADFNYDATVAMANSAIDMCFKDSKTYISGIKEFAIRATIILFMTNVDCDTTMDFKDLYTEILYGDLWNRFLSINKKQAVNIKTLRDVISDAIDKYFFAIIG